MANTTAASALTLPDILKDALTKKFGTDNPLMQQRGTALQNFLTAGTTDKYSNPANNNNVVYSPTQQRSLEATDRAAAVVPLVNLNDIISQGYGGIGNVVDSASRAYQANAKVEEGKATLSQNKYLDALDNLRFTYNAQVEAEKQAEQIRQFNESQATNKSQFGQTLTENQRQFNLTPHTVGGSAGVTAANVDGLRADVQKGKTLNDVLATYAGKIDPNDILSVYNAASPYGPAKESYQQLQAYGITDPRTAQQENSSAAIQPAITALSGLNSKGISKVGPQNRGVNEFALNWLGGMGVDSDLVGLNQQLELAKQTLLNSFQNGRISDFDYKTAQNYMPTIYDTTDNFKTKLSNLNSFLGNLGGSSTSNSGGGGSWQ